MLLVAPGVVCCKMRVVRVALGVPWQSAHVGRTRGVDNIHGVYNRRTTGVSGPARHMGSLVTFAS